VKIGQLEDTKGVGIARKRWINVQQDVLSSCGREGAPLDDREAADPHKLFELRGGCEEILVEAGHAFPVSDIVKGD
jgi:hypothetical protein